MGQSSFLYAWFFLNKKLMTKKKILFLIESFAGGGVEKVFVDLINNIDIKKYDITR